MVSKQVCVLGMLLALCSDCVLCIYSLLDASFAEEDIEGEFYQEEEDYPDTLPTKASHLLNHTPNA
jgi:hypothetical protein